MTVLWFKHTAHGLRSCVTEGKEVIYDPGKMQT
jgi:hypothetical protein